MELVDDYYPIINEYSINTIIAIINLIIKHYQPLFTINHDEPLLTIICHP